jgi:hypothetical protein
LNQVPLGDSEHRRTFLADHDTVEISGRCFRRIVPGEGEGGEREGEGEEAGFTVALGFGSVVGRVMPAGSSVPLPGAATVGLFLRVI